LRAGADKEKTDRNGWSPLFAACHSGDDKIVEVLLREGADKEHANVFGRTPLIAACSSGHAKIVDTLLRYGADKNRRSNGWTPLSSAAFVGNANVVEVLLRAGADIEAVDEMGNTALAVAITRGRPECAKILIRAGAKLPEILPPGLTDEFRRELLSSAIPARLSFLGGVCLDRIGAQSPVGMLGGFPEITRFIVVHSFNGWMLDDKKKLPEIP